MNRRQGIKQALLKLLPELTEATLPRELETLTEALDSVHVHLEDNQKAAKLYLCAHVACDELKFHLNLPALRLDRPPVPPKLYNKLYEQVKQEPQIRNVLSRSKTSNSAQEERQLAQVLIEELCAKLGSAVPASLVHRVMETSSELRRSFSAKTLVAASYLITQSVIRKRHVNQHRGEYDEAAEAQEDDVRLIDPQTAASITSLLSVSMSDVTRAYKQLYDTVGDKNWFLELLLGSGELDGPKKQPTAGKRFVMATMASDYSTDNRELIQQMQPMYDFRSKKRQQQQAKWEADQLQQIKKLREAAA